MDVIRKAQIDALKAMKLSVNKDGLDFKSHGLIYRTTNENLTALCNSFDLSNKNILTVNGSGDQYLAFLLSGAKDVYNFDINELSYYYLVLKQTGVLTLDFEEFTEYFMMGTNSKEFCRFGYFDSKIYKKISEKLPIHVKLFWDILINDSKYKLDNDDGESLFIGEYSPTLYETIPFLNEGKYDKLKNRIIGEKAPKFITSDVRNIINKTNKKFDIIYLSNIGDYVINADEWILFIMLELRNMLTKNGLIISHYRWFESKESEKYLYYGFNKIRINSGTKDLVYTYKVGN